MLPVAVGIQIEVRALVQELAGGQRSDLVLVIVQLAPAARRIRVAAIGLVAVAMVVPVVVAVAVAVGRPGGCVGRSVGHFGFLRTRCGTALIVVIRRSPRSVLAISNHAATKRNTVVSRQRQGYRLAGAEALRRRRSASDGVGTK